MAEPMSNIEQTCRRTQELSRRLEQAALASVELDQVLLIRSRLAIDASRALLRELDKPSRVVSAAQVNC